MFNSKDPFNITIRTPKATYINYIEKKNLEENKSYIPFSNLGIKMNTAENIKEKRYFKSINFLK